MLRPRAREGAQNVTLEMFMHCGWWELPGDVRGRDHSAFAVSRAYTLHRTIFTALRTNYKRQDSTLPLLI